MIPYPKGVDRGAFLLDYSNGVDTSLLTNPAADRFCVCSVVLDRPYFGTIPQEEYGKNKYENKKTKKKPYEKGGAACVLFNCS